MDCHMHVTLLNAYCLLSTNISHNHDVYCEFACTYLLVLCLKCRCFRCICMFLHLYVVFFVSRLILLSPCGDQWSAGGSVNMAVHFHFRTSQEIQPLILHLARVI